MNRFLNKRIFISIYYALFIFCLLRIWLTSFITGYTKESWQISEFLINYEGGFVRRGLLGEIIFKLHHFTGIDPYKLILGLCILCYLILATFFVRSFIKKGYSLFILPFVIFLGNPIINNFWVRKDILILLLFISILYFLVKKTTAAFIAGYILLFLGLLIHESFAFIGFPFLILYTFQKKTGSSAGYFFRRSLLLFPALAAFFIIIKFKGNTGIAAAIWSSWKSIKFPLQFVVDDKVPAAIEGIGWTLKQGLSYTFNTFLNFDGGIYGPLAWFIIIVSVYYLLINADKMEFSFAKKYQFQKFDTVLFSNVLILQLIAIIPLFILGWDYSRWMFFWVASSFAIWLIVPQQMLINIFPKFISTISQRVINFFNTIFGYSKSFVFFLCLIIGFPGFSWSLIASLNNSSLFIVLKFISDQLKKVLHAAGYL